VQNTAIFVEKILAKRAKVQSTEILKTVARIKM